MNQIPTAGMHRLNNSSARFVVANPILLRLLILSSLNWTALRSPAIVREWTGNVNSSWTEGGNWTPLGSPQTGDALIFPASATRYDSVNDFVLPPQLASITLAGGGYHLSGTNVKLDLEFTDSHTSGGANRVSFFLYFTGAAKVSVTGAQSDSVLDLHGQIRVGGSEDATIFVAAPGEITLHDAIVGDGDTIKLGSGDIYFRSGNPNYYRYTHILEGTAHLLGSLCIPANPGRLVIGSNGVSQATVYVGPIAWAGSLTIEVNNSHLVFPHDTGTTWLELREGAVVDGAGSLTIYGGVVSYSDVLTPVINLPLNIYPAFTSFSIHGSNYSGVDIQTSIGGPGGIAKTGKAALVLQHSNSFSGNISVAAGILDATGASALGSGTNVTLYGTGFQAGSLTLRNAAVSGKTLQAHTPEQITPNLFGTALTSVGNSSWSGPVVLHTNLAVLGDTMTFNGPISGTGGMIFRNASATLGGTEANTFTGATLALGSLLQFNKSSGVQNFGGPLVVGGGSQPTSEVRWLQDYQRLYAEVTIHTNGLVNLNNHWDDFGPITFHGGMISTGTGELGIYDLVTVNAADSTATINGRLGLPPGYREFHVDDGSAWPDLRINASIVGPGHLRKTGTGLLWLAGVSTYTGMTVVDQGTLSVLNPFALGEAMSGTTVANGATLELNAINGNLPEPLALRGTGDGGNGALNVFGIAALRNSFPSIYAAIDLTTNTTIRVGPGSLLTVDGFISGVGPLTKTGPGTLIYSNANANTYSGATVIADGTLQLAKPDYILGVPGDLVAGPAPASSSVLVRWAQSGGINPNAIATANAGTLLDLNGFNQTLARVNLNDGADVQTGAGTLSFPAGGIVNVGSLSLLGSHASSSLSGKIGLPANSTLTFAVSAYAPTPPFDFGPELDVSASIPAPVENVLFERAGLTKAGVGRMRLSGNNSFNGWVDVAEGTLAVAGNTALGNAFRGTYVFNNAALELQNGLTVANENVVLNSTANPTLFSWAGNNAWNGLITLQRASTVQVGTGTSLYAGGAVVGTGHFTKAGAGALTFGGSNPNTFSGDTYVNLGTLDLQKPAGVAAIPNHVFVGNGGGSATLLQQSSFSIIGAVTVGGGGVWDLTGFTEGFSSATPPPITLNDGGSVFSGSSGIIYLPVGGNIIVNPGDGSTSSTIQGNLGLDPGPHIIQVANGSNLGALPGCDLVASIGQSTTTASLQKDGPGTLRLAGVNSFTGTSTVNEGVLRVDGSQPNSPIQVNASAKLQGVGTVGTVDFLNNGGLIVPGSSPGILHSSSFNNSAQGSGTLQVELNGPNPGANGYDQLNVSGTVNLSGVALELTASFEPNPNHQFTLINNDGSDAVAGTFTGLPQNASVFVGNQEFRISYTGGSGNDVVLTATPPRPRLVIERSSPSSVCLLWPTNDPAYQLQFITNLTSTNWTSVLPLPVVVGTNFVVTNLISKPPHISMVTNRAWYRLGENDGGAASGLPVTGPTADFVGTNHLVRHGNGNPHYTDAVSASAAEHVASSLAIQFNTSGQFFSNAVVTAATDNFGLELWVKPTGGGNSLLAYNGIPDLNGWGLYWQSGFFLGKIGSGIVAVGGAPFGQWSHVALVRDNGMSTLYVNGVPTGSDFTFPEPPTGSFAIGSAGSFYLGEMDEVRLFTFAPGQFTVDDLLIHRVSNISPSKFYRLFKP